MGETGEGIVEQKETSLSTSILDGSHDQIFHRWATRHSNAPGLWKVCFLFMRWVRPICGRGWRTSTLTWA